MFHKGQVVMQAHQFHQLLRKSKSSHSYHDGIHLRMGNKVKNYFRARALNQGQSRAKMCKTLGLSLSTRKEQRHGKRNQTKKACGAAEKLALCEMALLNTHHICCNNPTSRQAYASSTALQSGHNSYPYHGAQCTWHITHSNIIHQQRGSHIGAQ